MKSILVVAVFVVLCGPLSTSAAKSKIVSLLQRLRCKNHWDCKMCDEVKRQGRCHTGYLMGVCYKTCTGCDKYFDKAGYDCASIKRQNSCFVRMKVSPYVTPATYCEDTCCQAYPLSPTPSSRFGPSTSSSPPSTSSSPTSTSSPPTSTPLSTTSLPRTYWNEWGPWGPCSKTCHKGFRIRSRNCSSSNDPRVDCSRPQRQYGYCNVIVSCVVDGGFSEWSQWDSCPVTCGTGTQSRTRTCTNPPPQNGGQNCAGPNSMSKQCYEGCCPEAGSWSTWSRWSTCSKSCCTSKTDCGHKTRSRSCTNPAPFCGAGPCLGSPFEREKCLPTVLCKPRPSSPYWGNWGPWQPCSATCYVGYRVRSRKCIGYKGDGNFCRGRLTKYESCNTDILC